MKLLAPIAAFIAAASAGQIYAGQSAQSYAQSAEQYQSALEHQQNGLYSEQSQTPQTFSGHEAVAHEESYNSRPSGEKTARILFFNNENNAHQYQYSYETENGIKAEEEGHTSEHGSTVSNGAYSYKGDDGETYTVTYTADEHGFHPQGAHLPTPPPIPEAILKSLEQNAKDEAAGIVDDGKYKEQSGQGMVQQHDASYQTVGYQAPSIHSSGAELAYHAHSGNALSGISGHSSGAQAVHPASSGHGSSVQLAYHVPSGHDSSAQSAYHAPSGHGFNAQSAYYAPLARSSSSQLMQHAPSSHGATAQISYHVPSGHLSGPQGAYHVPSSHSSGAQMVYSAQSGYASSGHASAPVMLYHGHH